MYIEQNNTLGLADRLGEIMGRLPGVAPALWKELQVLKADIESRQVADRAEIEQLRAAEATCTEVIGEMILDIVQVGEALGIPDQGQKGGVGEFIDAIRQLQRRIVTLTDELAQQAVLNEMQSGGQRP
ncbi:hypothetical protein C5U62_31525 [Pseudomonas protegens]|uniref:Uncharacterized protein n=1 Tax=Pseudomonas protegens TaxID=380021 RepID=A0A2T6GBG1_9PSED|nr:hypothetical protein [Pseudomonas protegens]PUA41498.1 hypothetical protein C5U62_31525 [Pseudomonas protegens]